MSFPRAETVIVYASGFPFPPPLGEVAKPQVLTERAPAAISMPMDIIYAKNRRRENPDGGFLTKYDPISQRSPTAPARPAPRQRLPRPHRPR